jgi:hypothetical protein
MEELGLEEVGLGEEPMKRWAVAEDPEGIRVEVVAVPTKITWEAVAAAVEGHMTLPTFTVVLQLILQLVMLQLQRCDKRLKK